MIPSVIRDICAYLSDDDLTLTKSSDDGRLNSAINETEVLKRIQRHFFVKVPQVRDWYDFAIEADGEFCPVNIKITNLSTDNLNCKLAVYYTLTGLMPDFPNGIGYLKYFAKLKKDIGANKEKDYYYIIVNK